MRHKEQVLLRRCGAEASADAAQLVSRIKDADDRASPARIPAMCPVKELLQPILGGGRKRKMRQL